MMSMRRSQGCQLRIKEKMERMRRDHKMNHHDTEVEQMFDRMHGQPRPWARIGIHVMYGMDGFEERPPVNKPVDRIKMRFSPEWDKQEKYNEPNRVFRHVKIRYPLVGQSPDVLTSCQFG